MREPQPARVPVSPASQPQWTGVGQQSSRHYPALGKHGGGTQPSHAQATWVPDEPGRASLCSGHSVCPGQHLGAEAHSVPVLGWGDHSQSGPWGYSPLTWPNTASVSSPWGLRTPRLRATGQGWVAHWEPCVLPSRVPGRWGPHSGSYAPLTGVSAPASERTHSWLARLARGSTNMEDVCSTCTHTAQLPTRRDEG